MALKIPIILALTFFNIESIFARPQFPPLKPPGPPREPAPIHEPQSEGTLDVHRPLFTAYTSTNRQYFETNGLNNYIPSYSTSAGRTQNLFSPETTIASYSTNSNSYVKSFSNSIASSGASGFLPVVQNQPKTSVSYSEAPLVSHVTFAGLGSSYSW